MAPSPAEALARLPTEAPWWCLASPRSALLGWDLRPATLDDMPPPSTGTDAEDPGLAGWNDLDARWLVQADYDGPVQVQRIGSAARWHAGQPPMGHELPATASPSLATVTTGPLTADWTQQQHRTAVLDIRERIAAGECYQVNLTLTFRARCSGDPLALAQRVVRMASGASGPGFAAVLHRPGQPLVLCASPECLWSLHGDRLRTRPIKGTRPAGRRDELESSRKEAAELAMIVDLMRNDLGRLAVPGTVTVPEPGATIDLPYVHHRAATVAAQVRPHTSWAHLLHTLLPAGSITGTPKLRAMQVIRQLESGPRGPYCGSIGWIAADGRRGQGNVAIRTATVADGWLTIHAGGGIVADSDPDLEWEEAWAKTRAFAEVLT